MGFIAQLGNADRTMRIAGSWARLLKANSWRLLDPLAAVGPDMPARRALALANVEGAGGLHASQDIDFRDGLAEVLTVPDPARILFDGYGEHLRPNLARELAHREGREHPTFADYAVADLQIVITHEWAARSRRAGFRRATPDVLRDITAEWNETSPFPQPQHERFSRQTPPNPTQFAAKNCPVTETVAYIGSRPKAASAAMLTLDDDTRQKLVFGRNMVRGRMLAGITQETLGQLLGVNRRQIMRWEHGDYEPRPPMRKRIAHELGQPLPFFFDEQVLEDWPPC